MKYKAGALMVDFRGSAGGTTASQNTYSKYLKNKSTPVNPSTVAQQLVRSFMATISQSWKGITQAQRDLWNQITSSYQTTNVFGDLMKYTGFNLYVKLNRNLLEIGEAQIADAPAPAAPAGMLSLSLDADINGPKLELAFTDPIDAADKVIVYATAPQSAGKQFVKSEYRKVHVLDSTDTTPVDIIAEYSAKFGGLGAIDGKIFVQLRPVNIATGNPGTVLGASVLVVDTTP
jgi:hypothetical protein